MAKNTLLLYFRMFLLLLIGLFTSRVVLRTLGVDDYGVYNVVGGVVTVFTFLTTSISAAISRYLAVGLGKGDPAHLRRIFSTGVLIQIGLSLLLAPHPGRAPGGGPLGAAMFAGCARGHASGRPVQRRHHRA